ncbi:hypothetical protein GGI17_000163 [Coemansia sp. S146]|nr:hypothetical protein GGI17_000163 [Coemansia sp. S146]
MSNDKPPVSNVDAPSLPASTDSTLMTFLNSISGASMGNSSAALPSHDILDLSSILPVSGSHLQSTSNGGASNMITPLPLDADLDLIMRSLDDSVDVSKVSSEDIDKLLGSINVDFSANGGRSGVSTSASNVDSLASLSLDLGLNLSAPTSLPPNTLSIATSEPMFTLNPLAGISNSGLSAADFSQTGFHVASMPASPGLSGINDHALQRTGSLSSSFGNTREDFSDSGSSQQSRSLQAQSQFQSLSARPPLGPPNMQAARRPPPNNPQQQQQQQRSMPNRPQMPVQHGGKPAPPRPSPNTAATGAQRPPRPANPAQAARPVIRTRPPYNGSPASHSQQGSPSPAGSPHPESSPLQNRQARPAPPQAGLHSQDMHMQNQPRRPPAPGTIPGTNARPQQRPQARPGPGAGATDPSKWLASTMGALPTDQQERLAGLFRGLQTKTIDFQSFVRDAEAIMGPKFQDLLVIMRNQGGRPPMPQQRPPEFGRPHAAAGPMLNSSQPTMMRPGHPMSTPATRPGMQHQQHSSPSMAMSSQTPEGSRSLAMMHQLMSQNHQTAGGDSLGNMTGINDILPLALSSALYQNGSTASAAGQGATLGSMHAPIPGHPLGNPFDAVIARWRQIILNPNIPGEQLVKLSMQLSAYGDLLVNPNGDLASIPDEAKSQQFAQISKLQALIAQRQFARGPASSIGPPASQPESRPESPMLDGRPQDPKKKSTPAKPIKDASTPAKAKKRAADSRRSGSPAARTPMKKQRTGDDGGSDLDVEMQPARPAYATGSSRPLGSMSAFTAGTGASTPLNGSRDMPGAYLNSGDLLGAPVARKGISRTSTAGTTGDASGSDGETSRPYGGPVGHAGSDSKGKGPEIASRERERIAPKELPRKFKDRREMERAGSSAGPSAGNISSIHDVIGYTGVDLREESEIILGNMVHQGAYQRTFASREAEGPLLSSRVVEGVEISHDRSLATHFVNARVMEAIVAKICKREHIKAVSADAVPYLTLALQDRLRSFMELVSAAAHHRSRTQTLPPPPLNSDTRLPLYKITPHLDVKKQLVVLERVDQMREQARQQQLTEREQRNILDRQQQQQQDSEGDNPHESMAQPAEAAREGSVDVTVAGGSDEYFGGSSDMPKSGSTAKRGRKKDDNFVETAAYTSKNMPDELRNKISNQTALRAAGGIRKSWMTPSGTSDWLSATSTMRASSRPATGDVLSAALDADGTSGKRAPSVGGLTPSNGFGGTGSIAHGHKRNRSSLGTASDFEGAVSASPGPDGSTPTSLGSLRPPPPLASHRSTSLTTPLLVTVRDCLFSLERERLSNVRVGRGGGDRVLIRAYTKYVHD